MSDVAPFNTFTQHHDDYIVFAFDPLSGHFVYKCRLQLAHTHGVLLHLAFLPWAISISLWAIHGKGRYGAIWAMVSDDDSKLGAIPTFPLRMQRTLRTRVEVAARANRRSVNSEIVARLARSFDMAAPEIDPGDVPASPTAREALALAKDNLLRTKAIEEALRAICSEDAYLDCLNGPAIDLLQRVLSMLPPKGT
jgi:hypothetical protein